MLDLISAVPYLVNLQQLGWHLQGKEEGGSVCGGPFESPHKSGYISVDFRTQGEGHLTDSGRSLAFFI